MLHGGRRQTDRRHVDDGSVMPRAKPPPQRRTTFGLGPANAYWPTISAIVDEADRLKDLPADKRHQLKAELIFAVGFAKAGVPRAAMRGKGTRPAARTLDVLVSDVGDALRQVGVNTTMNPDPTSSRGQWLAREIAIAIGLPGHTARRGVGNLFKQAQRARHIVKRRFPGTPAEPARRGGEHLR